MCGQCGGKHLPTYQDISLKLRYSPWEDDENFLQVYNAIKEHTLVDIMRCYELWQLSGVLSYVPGDVLEVGVWRGGSAALVASRMPKGRKIFLADTFYGVVKSGMYDNRYRGGEHSDTSIATVHELFVSLGINHYSILAGVFPDDTGKDIEDTLFSFVHIDVDVYQSAYDIVQWVWPRVSVGGMVIFDDYGFESCQGVQKLVHTLFPLTRTDAFFVYNLNGHGIVEKKA